MLGEGDAALVPRRRPGMLAKPGIVREHPRIGRQQLCLVAMDGRKYAARHEVCSVLEQPDELIDHLGNLDGHRAAGELAIGKQEHRHLLEPLAQLAQKHRRLIVRRLIIAAEVPIEQHGAKRSVAADDCPTVVERLGADDLDVARFQGRSEAFGGPADGRVGPSQRVIDDEGTWPQGTGGWIQHGLTPPGTVSPRICNLWGKAWCTDLI